MFCKTVVFDHHLFIYLFIPLFIVQTKKKSCVCLSVFCFCACLHMLAVLITRIVGLFAEHVESFVAWMICQSAVGLCHLYELLHYVTGKQPSRHNAMCLTDITKQCTAAYLYYYLCFCFICAGLQTSFDTKWHINPPKPSGHYVCTVQWSLHIPPV